MRLNSTSFLNIFVLFGIMILLLFSCKKKQDNDQENVSKRLLLLKVDYLTHDFEGGQQLEMAAYTNLSDTLPLIVNYIAPSDFGSLSISIPDNCENVIWASCKIFFVHLLVSGG